MEQVDWKHGRRAAGARGGAAGQTFESRLIEAQEAYLAMGLARLAKLPVPTAPAPGNVMRFIAGRCGTSLMAKLRILARRQSYDFYGYFGPNAGPSYDPGAYHGLAIAMEAKTTSAVKTTKGYRASVSLPIKASTRGKGQKAVGGSGVSIHQLDALAGAYRDFGVVATVVWRNDEDRYVLMPDRVLIAQERYDAGGRRSIPLSEFTQYDVVAYPDHPAVEDWLFPVRCWLEQSGRPSPALSKRKAYEMIPYTMDAGSKTVTIPKPNCDDLVVTSEVTLDRVLIDQIAREVTDPDEFAARLGRLGSANEST